MLDVNTIQKGYNLKVQLEYPKQLHNLHNDYLLAPEKIEIKNSMLSKCCRKVANEYNISVGEVKNILPSV